MFTALRADPGQEREEVTAFTSPQRSNVLPGALQASSERNLISQKGKRAGVRHFEKMAGGFFTCTERGSCMTGPNLPPTMKE